MQWTKNTNKYLTGIIFLMAFIMPEAVFGQERLSVVSSIANVRSGPGTNEGVLWQVEQYHPFIVVEKKGNWYKVRDFEEDVAWIHNSLLKKIDAVITVKDKCNVRSGPDAKSRVLFTVDRGVPFKALERKGSWIKIQHADGDTGWIHNSLVW